MEKLDNNDAVQFDDAYSKSERKIIIHHIGLYVQDSYLKCPKIYQEESINSIFKTYEQVGHWTTSVVNLDFIKIFSQQMQKN